MNCSIIHRAGILFMALMIFTAHSIFAQCGFQSSQPNGCQGFFINITDTTTGSSHTNWSAAMPSGSVPATVTLTNSRLFSINTGLPGVLPGTVTVTMTDSVAGHICTHTGTFQIYANPVINGTFSNTTTCTGTCVYWNDASSWGTGCSQDSFLMDWQNSSSFQISPARQCEVYNTAGSFHPTIILINSCGCRADTTFTAPIVVTAPPSASFTGSNLSSCTSPFNTTLTATSNASNARYSWYVSSTGTFGTTPAQATGSNTFNHTYPAGTYNVKLVVLDTLNGCTDSVIQTNIITAGANQAANFTAGATSGCGGSQTYTPTTVGATTYAWSVTGASGCYNPTGVQLNTTNSPFGAYFYCKGHYDVGLTVSYPGGCYDTMVQHFSYGTGTAVNFTTVDTQSCHVPFRACLTYTGASCPGCSFVWTPAANVVPGTGDSTGVCYNITSFGGFTPTLTVTDSFGCQSSLYRYGVITVAPLSIVVNKVFANGSGCANDVIILNDTSSTGGPFTTVSWNLPGANVISQNNKVAQISYSSPGCYGYSVTMTSASGCTATYSDTICIRPKPVVTLTVGPHDICYEASANIFSVRTSLPNDTPTSVQVWPEGLTPPGGPSFTIPKTGFDSTSYMYQDFGSFSICYLASNGGCLGDTICPILLPADSVYILPPIPSFNLVPSCATNLTRTLKNASTGYSSILWNFNGTNYLTQGDLTVNLPSCGVKYAVSLTAYNDTTGCQLTKTDSISVPCYGADFSFAQTKGCYYAYASPANIIYTVPNAEVPTLVVWDVEPSGSSPTFSPNGITGTPLSYYNLYTPAVYDAYVQVTYASGCKDTLVKHNYIDISLPVPSFSTNDTNGCIPFCVNFTNTSTVLSGKIKHFEWSFGDASNVDSTNFNPSHCYTAVGQYEACLKIVDTNGCFSTACLQISADNVVANFSETDSITCLKNASPLNPLTYTSTSTGFVSTYKWLLPSALGPVPATISGNQSSITEQYTIPGSGRIGLVAIDQFGTCRDTVWKPIRIANPVASYGLPNASDTFFPCAPVPLCLVDSSKNNICSFSYLLGDGTVDTAQNPCHIWTSPGTYPITQIVNSCHGCSDTITKYTIKIAGPTLTTTVDKRGGCPCTTITWTATSTGTDQINFTSGGGTPLFENVPVTIGTVSNPTVTQFTATYCNTGHVQPVITANSTVCSPPPFPIQSVFIDTPNTAFSYTLGSCRSDSVCFHNLTTFNAPESFDSLNSWNFGDGSALDTSTNPCHHFPHPGDYTVTLTVKNQLLCTSTLSKVVHVPAPPVAAYTLTDSVGCVPFLVPFVDVSTVDPATTMSGYWEFGDGTTLNNTASTSHNYTASGSDNATLVIIDGYGCVDSTTHVIQTNGTPSITLGANQTICLGDTARLSVSGGTTYQWSPNYNIYNATTGTPSVWPTVDTFYALQIGATIGCTTYDTIHVYVSKLTVTADTVINTCSNQVATFIDTAVTTHATISSYIWTFGDGSASVSGQNVTHQYARAANYSDTLIVTNSLGCADTVIRSVKILDIPRAAFSLSVDSTCVGAPVIATNNSTIGTGGALAGFTFYTPASSTVSPYTFVTATSGLDTVMLIQTDVNQCVDTAIKVINIYALPSTFNIEYIICNGDIITLQANTTDSVLWSPNYNISSTTSLTPRVWPAVDTVYDLRVGTNPLCYIHDTVSVVHSVFTVTADTALPVCLGLSSTFTAAATAFSATISSYNWNFGDGTGLIGNTVTHQYTAYGTYQDTLIIISSRGCHDTVISSAIVYDHPHAALTVSLDSVCLGSPFSVTNQSTPGASIGDSAFYFNFGYPPLATTSPATFSYQVPGTQTITVVEIDSNQCVDSAKGHILVHRLPDANFTYDTSCVNINNQYISNSTIGDGQITQYSWTVNGLAVSGNKDSINYIFQTPGPQAVCLNVLDTFGCQRDTCMNVVIVSKPTFTTVYDSTICAGSSDSISITGLVTGAHWVPSTWVSDPNSPNTVVTPLQTVGYQVTVYYHNCTPVVDTVGIWVIDTVPVSATVDPLNIVLGLSSNVTSTVRGTIDSMIWSPDSSLSCRNCRNPIASPHQTTTYTATIYYSKNGVVCSNTTNVTVTVFTSCDGSLIYVPNTFTPNNDGVDDIFRLQGQGISSVEYFRVYDQWGKKIYNAENVDDANLAVWNGGLNNDNLNKPMNTGVYVYEFQIKCITGQTVAGRGNITLLR